MVQLLGERHGIYHAMESRGSEGGFNHLLKLAVIESLIAGWYYAVIRRHSGMLTRTGHE